MKHLTSCVLECSDRCTCHCHSLATISQIEKEFLDESNQIEGVFDFRSLDQAIYAWQYLKGKDRLDTHTVLKAHKILMLHQPLMPNEKGYFRTVPVYISGRECPVLSPDGWPLTTLVSQWCHEATRHPETWQRDHVTFEKIHPFIDGNGRIGRMLMNWQRLKGGMDILVIKASERRKYYDWFE